MRTSFRSLLLTALLGTTGAMALAQTPPAAPIDAGAPPPSAARSEWRGRIDPAQRQEMMGQHHARRMTNLKAKLNLTPAQEGAWTAFSTAMQPPLKPQRPVMDRTEMDKLTTPQRIERMEVMRAERMGQMNQRLDAIKTFYAQLTPEQQKVFDQQHLMMAERHHGGPGMHRPMPMDMR